MINVGDGSIQIQNKELIIKPGITVEQFIKSDLYAEVIDEQGRVFYLKPQLIGDKRFIITICFSDRHKIDFINLSMLHGNEIPSWENWSENNEIKRNKEHAKWLKAQIGKAPYNYDWGEITPYYDPRSGSSIITIKYK